MKKTVIIIFILFTSIIIYSQEDPFYKQYLFNNSLINPAIASRDNYISIRFIDRHQWVGINDAPQNQSISVNTKIRNKMGVGGNFYNEKYGALRKTGLQLSYFYDIRLNADKIGSKLSFSLYGSIFQKSLSESELHTLDPNDPAITGETESAFFPQAGAGIFYYNRIFSVGLSASNLIPSKEGISNSEYEPNKIRTYFLYSDFTYSNEISTFAVVPSILIKVDEKLNREININAKIYFKEFIWFGLSYRDALQKNIYQNHSISGLVGLRLFDMVYFGYRYEVGLNNIQSYNSGTHEIMLGGNIYSKKQNTPRYF